ncbi:MAG TPA: outer membrane beta-barrel protein [Geobacteraceae bacterium]
MKRSLIVVAAVAALAVPALSPAAPIRPGPYVSGFVGVSGASNTDATTTDFVGGGTFNERVKFDPSINVGGTGGFDFGVVRLEGELSYKRGEISSITSQNVATGTTSQIVDVDGSLGVLAMMVNTFIDLHNYSPITPYIGGGIGFAALHLTDTFGTNISGTTPSRGLVYERDDDTVFAYQLGGGLEVALNRRLSLDLGYRYFATSKAHFDNNLITTNMKFESHNGAVGIRVKF